MLQALCSFIMAAGTSVGLHLALIRPAVSLGLVDVPQGRKAHRGEIPLIGGLAMFCAFTVSLAVAGGLHGAIAVIVAGGAVMVFCGLLDDFFFLAPASKLVVQIGTALMIVLIGDTIGSLGFGSVLQGQGATVIAAGLTLVFLVGSMNAFNMLDGADGLAGGLAVIAAGWLALAGSLSGQAAEATASALLASVVVGFLTFNAPFGGRRARVFMGDAGSLMLGCLLAALAARLCGKGAGSVPFVALLWVFALPALDAGSVIVRRIAAGGSPFRSDSRHIHLICRREGLELNWIVGGLWSASALLGGIGIVGWRAGLPDSVLLIGLVVPALIHSGFVRYSGKLLAVHQAWDGRLHLSPKREARGA